MSAAKPTSVLFVCLGNICRSPTSEVLFTALAAREGLLESLHIDSCGTSDWHIGSSPDSRATAAAAERGYEIHHLRGRQVDRSDFDRFDYILAMDEDNLSELETLRPGHYSGHLGLFLEFAADTALTNVPDPYYNGEEGFVQVLDLVESASAGLLQRIAGGQS